MVILKEEVSQFTGQVILKTDGNSKIDQTVLVNQQVTAFKSWGKHFLICLTSCNLKIHFLMFGSYRVNERKDATPRLSLAFEKGELNLYSCSIKVLEEDLESVYDWSGDVMADEWDAAKALKKLRKQPDTELGDALLDQDIFAGVGNIIKNEVLFRIHLHPETKLGNLKPGQLKQLVDAAREYSFDFYNWKKVYQLKKHWQVYNKRSCPTCKLPLIKKHTGNSNRRSFFCSNCQPLPGGQ